MAYRKYRNKKQEVDGITFDSRAEALRYYELKMLQNAGHISDLTLQPRFVLQEKFRHGGKTERAIMYIADFMYCEDGRRVVEDVKGKRTKEYSIKRKMFLCRYGDRYEFREIEA